MPLYTLMYMGVFCVIKNDNIRITITIPKKLYDLIKSDAEYEDRTMSNFIARILKKHYKMNIKDE